MDFRISIYRVSSLGCGDKELTACSVSGPVSHVLRHGVRTAQRTKAFGSRSAHMSIKRISGGRETCSSSLGPPAVLLQLATIDLITIKDRYLPRNLSPCLKNCAASGLLPCFRVNITTTRRTQKPYFRHDGNDSKRRMDEKIIIIP